MLSEHWDNDVIPHLKGNEGKQKKICEYSLIKTIDWYQELRWFINLFKKSNPICLRADILIINAKNALISCLYSSF